MRVSYSPLHKNGSGHCFDGKLVFLIPIFILAVFLGFLLELITIEKLNLLLRIPLSRKAYHHPSRDQPPESTQQQVEYFTAELKTLVGSNNGPLWEKPILLNVSHFQWLRNNESICQVDVRHPKARILPILVHTARSHVSERLIIRKSWGSLLGYKKWSVRLVFLIGQADRGLDHSKNEDAFKNEEALLDSEQSMFGDIVQGTFIDSYRNLTYKHMMGYKWILNFCSNAAFVMKADDDMFIDLMRFLNWRNDDLLANRRKKPGSKISSPIPELYCSTFVGTKPQRCVGCKWYTSEVDWPLDYYPDYCSGWCYGITVDLMKKLYSVLETARFYWIDDVFATGVLMEEVKKAYPGFEPRYKHLWGQVRTLDFKNFRPMCERHDITMKRKFGAVVPLPRGSNFQRDMMCLWNKTVYDDENEEFKKENFDYDDDDDDKD